MIKVRILKTEGSGRVYIVARTGNDGSSTKTIATADRAARAVAKATVLADSRSEPV